MTTNIPEARNELRQAMEILRDVGTLESKAALNLVHSALTKMKRRVAKTNRRTIARKMTPQLVREIQNFIKNDTNNLTYVEIGAKFGVNGGRVSEIYNGVRTAENTPLEHDGYNRTLHDLKEGAVDHGFRFPTTYKKD